MVAKVAGRTRFHFESDRQAGGQTGGQTAETGNDVVEGVAHDLTTDSGQDPAGTHPGRVARLSPWKTAKSLGPLLTNSHRKTFGCSNELERC